MTGRRNEMLDCIKGMLILIVCIGHAIQFGIYKSGDFWGDPVFKYIYMFHMPLFMAIAGYLSYSGLSKSASIIGLIKKRVISYTVPIISWATIIQLVHLVIKGGSPSNLPFAIVREAAGSLWFLWALLGSIVLMSAAQATRNYRAATVTILFALTLFIPEKGNIHLFKYTFPYFLTGFYLANWTPRINLTKFHTRIITFILGVGSIFCFIYWSRDTYIYISGMTLQPNNYQNIIFRWISGFIVSGFSALLMISTYRIMPSIAKKLLAAAGADSLYIYIIQSYAFIFIGSAFVKYYNNSTNIIIGYLIVLIVSIITAYVCWNFGAFLSKNRHLSIILFGKSAPSPRIYSPAPQIK